MSLTDDQIYNIGWEISQQNVTSIKDWKIVFARAIESEVLGAQKQEPVAWLVTHVYKGVSTVFTTHHQEDISQYRARSEQYDVVPLYSIPQPCPKCAELEAENARLNKENRSLLKSDQHSITRRYAEQSEQLAALEAQLDRLMLEYCPNEMTPEQIEKWGEHQGPVDSINAERKR